MKNEIGINKEHADKLVGQLNELLANYSVFYQNLRGFHWNITGPSFFELHAKFEEMYNEANMSIDEIAERILTLGGHPLHTFADFESNSTIKAAKDVNDAKGTVQTTLDNLKVLLEKERSILETSGVADDEGTTDLMTGYIAAQEKTSWMLRAYIR